MAREAFNGVLNFDVREQKRTFVAAAGILRGLYRVSLEPAADTRTNRQNAFYWLILSRAAKYLSDGGQRQYGADEVHRAMGRRFLTETICDPNTGEVLDSYVGSTTRLTVEQMADYIDKVQMRLDEKYGIPPLEAEPLEVAHGR